MPLLSFAFQWSIQENQLLALKDSENGYLKSDSVSDIQGFNYCLKLDPNGYNDAKRGQMWTILRLELENLYKKSTGYGSSITDSGNFFNPEKKFIVDGKCVIKVYGTFKFKNENDAISDVEQQKWDGGELGNELWRKNDNKDFTIVVEGKEIKAHKLFLRTRSDIFRAMFNLETKEAMKNKIEIPDFTFEVVETAVKMIYNCNFTSFLSLDELMSLLQFFVTYNIPALKEKVELALMNQISVTTVCRLTNCSIFTNSMNLKKKCMEFLMASFSSKTYLSDIKILDNDVLKQIVQNFLFKDVETE